MQNKLINMQFGGVAHLGVQYTQLDTTPKHQKEITIKSIIGKIWGRSSPGRASEWHSEGSRFDPDRLHQWLSLHNVD